MKINKLLFLFSALTFVACNEEFLEEFPTSYITPEQIAEASQINPDLQAATVAGIYESMYKYGTGSANEPLTFFFSLKKKNTLSKLFSDCTHTDCLS